jgi:hypothetical protein
MMDSVNRFTSVLVGGVNGLLGGASPAVVLLIHSLLMALLVVAVYALVSNQQTIKTTRNRMVARLLEIRLFGDDPISVLGSFRRVLTATGFYIGASLKPLVVLLPIIVLWIGQLAGWFEWRPLTKGESVVVSMKLKEGVSPVAQPATLQVPGEFIVETPAFRSVHTNEVAWRVKAMQPGSGMIQCGTGAATVEKEITASSALKKVSPKRTADRFWDRVLFPGEDALAKDSPVAEVRVDYPRRSMRFFGYEINWLVAIFVASIVFALVVKRPFRVEF